jgi:four helix bundle protein
MKNQKGYRNLIAWQKADDLAFQIYSVTSGFPRKHFNLVSQMQRAALSVPANIVEGYARTTKKEKRRFYEIALSSLSELEYYIDFCFQLKLISLQNYNLLSRKQSESAKLLFGLKKSTLNP